MGLLCLVGNPLRNLPLGCLTQSEVLLVGAASAHLPPGASERLAGCQALAPEPHRSDLDKKSLPGRTSARVSRFRGAGAFRVGLTATRFFFWAKVRIGWQQSCLLCLISPAVFLWRLVRCLEQFWLVNLQTESRWRCEQVVIATCARCMFLTLTSCEHSRYTSTGGESL